MPVTVKGGGQTYQIGNGKVMEWDEVPPWFKEQLDMQQEEAKCAAAKLLAQRCIEDKGFWDEECVKLTDAFHLCQSNELRSQLPSRGPASKRDTAV